VSPIALARFTALCRVVIGGAFVAQPEVCIRPWIGRDAERPAARLLARALGARDVVIGLGTLRSAERRWLAGALAADAADLLLTVAAREHVPRRGRLLVPLVAGAGIALGAVALAGTRE
jgi:hypothetical protein